MAQVIRIHLEISGPRVGEDRVPVAGKREQAGGTCDRNQVGGAVINGPVRLRLHPFSAQRRHPRDKEQGGQQDGAGTASLGSRLLHQRLPFLMICPTVQPINPAGVGYGKPRISVTRASLPVLRPPETAKMAAPQNGGQTTSQRQERRRSTRGPQWSSMHTCAPLRARRWPPLRT